MADGMKFNMNIDKKTQRWFQKTAPQKLVSAKKKAVQAAGMAWADTAKEVTRNEGHIDTGLYVNSIGYKSGSPATDADVIHEIVDQNGKTILRIGSNVVYASSLEKRFNIMADALDQSKERMVKVSQEQIKRTLGL
ncbi:HK97 gp10 family phage protein [Sporolactobacillus sp. STSJ-5]|uniref:HK97 gp10 family phage protein n=1 Tax=Sporolactobacillus sp. STSJ-5 TaxID=2965076 RepID=UPI0021052C90|nr:HK97 gp10 family phage protein [Sporolactobacillus sp. STSJ-5]MCQ2010547.1 HK97 gp10 family phage protein [Sporolactobacillus sp. STSJ-5]